MPAAPWHPAMRERDSSVRSAPPRAPWPPYEPTTAGGPGPVVARAAPHVDCLDGLRGLAAAWVVVGHAMKLTG
jgi:hypothetical protein